MPEWIRTRKSVEGFGI